MKRPQDGNNPLAAAIAWLNEGSDSTTERWLRLLVSVALGSLLSGTALNTLEVGGHPLPATSRLLLTVVGVVGAVLAIAALTRRVPRRTVERMLHQQLS